MGPMFVAYGLWLLIAGAFVVPAVLLLRRPHPPARRRSTTVAGVLLLLLAIWLSPMVQVPIRRETQQAFLAEILTFRGRTLSEVEGAFGKPDLENGVRCYDGAPWFAPLGFSCVRLVYFGDEFFMAYIDD